MLVGVAEADAVFDCEAARDTEALGIGERDATLVWDALGALLVEGDGCGDEVGVFD